MLGSLFFIFTSQDQFTHLHKTEPITSSSSPCLWWWKCRFIEGKLTKKNERGFYSLSGQIKLIYVYFDRVQSMLVLFVIAGPQQQLQMLIKVSTGPFELFWPFTLILEISKIFFFFFRKVYIPIKTKDSKTSKLFIFLWFEMEFSIEHYSVNSKRLWR